jgi:HEAT repeat protein
MLADPRSVQAISSQDVAAEAFRHEMATNAIYHIGPAALPFLVKWLQYAPPPWRNTLATSLYRSRFPFAHKLSGLFVDERAWQLSVGAHYAFDVLGAKAMPAFSDLCRLMNDTGKPTVANMAASSLGNLGTNALPPLLAVLTNTNHPARVGAISAIRAMSDLDNAATIAVIHAVTNCITDTNLVVQVMAMTALGELRAAPQISVPALVSSLQSKDAKIRLYSATDLGNFGSQASSAVPALTNALTDSDPRVRYNAAQALHQIAPATFTNPPAQ